MVTSSPLILPTGWPLDVLAAAGKPRHPGAIRALARGETRRPSQAARLDPRRRRRRPPGWTHPAGKPRTSLQARSWRRSQGRPLSRPGSPRTRLPRSSHDHLGAASLRPTLTLSGRSVHPSQSAGALDASPPQTGHRIEARPPGGPRLDRPSHRPSPHPPHTRSPLAPAVSTPPKGRGGVAIGARGPRPGLRAGARAPPAGRGARPPQRGPRSLPLGRAPLPGGPVNRSRILRGPAGAVIVIPRELSIRVREGIFCPGSLTIRLRCGFDFVHVTVTRPRVFSTDRRRLASRSVAPRLRVAPAPRAPAARREPCGEAVRFFIYC